VLLLLPAPLCCCLQDAMRMMPHVTWSVPLANATALLLLGNSMVLHLTKSSIHLTGSLGFAALQDAKRMLPQVDVAKALRSSPDLVLSFQKGKHLIPYDEPWPISKSSIKTSKQHR
jgi:hypothetical protein